ncbi:uncharacterized protein QYS62_009925 [Fusarium acuminatum]|uniref:Small EDRK-rich factor-like N-terminal domain-containing protein n=1 Tax=Fusarium acuminatum TaxID=5515 RepID=A0ABZ2XA57_9HYPO
MANNNNHHDKPLSDEVREDVRRMTVGLTNQNTIETLSRAGMVAKNKRENSQAHRMQAIARAEAAKKEQATKKEAKGDGKTTDSGDHVKDGGIEPDKGNGQKQI